MRLTSLVAMALLFSVPGLARAQSSAPIRVGQVLPDFSLKTPWGKPYSLKSFPNQVLLVLYQGKSSWKQNKWFNDKVNALVAAGTLSKGAFRVVGIANFQESAAPNPLIRAILKMVNKRSQNLVLCDESGDLMKRWGFRNGRSNVYVLDRKRRLRWRTSGPLSQRRGKQLIRLLKRLTRR